MTDNFVKGYALIKAQCFSGSILDTYLPFIATIIIDEGMDVVDENIICAKLKEKYDATFQPTFVRQVLSNAMDKKLISKVRENYVANISALKKCCITDEDFINSWNSLITGFSKYGKKRGYVSNENEITKNITAFLDAYDDYVIFSHIGDIDTTDSQFMYHWISYILMLKENDIKQFAFVEGLCMANIAKATLFYSNQESTQKVDLQVFLDTPMIFALLGLDTPERQESYKYIVEKALAAGMSLHVYDHNLDEVLGIMERAAKWSQRADYDPAKANKVAQYFRSSDMTEEDMVEYIGDVEENLNLMGITQLNTGYDTEEDQFQADETKLSNAIKAEYSGRGSKYHTEGLFDNSVRTDVRSIVMTQRKRQGTLSTVIKTAKAIFITTNGAIAKVSKDMMDEDELSQNKIPVSVTADIFGTLLWMDYGDECNDYSSFKLLADCKALLRPSPKMIAKFVLSLDEAYQKKADGLTEEKFLFLRSHPIVATKLLDVTSGDYSQFTDNTWRDLYAKIEAHAQFEGDKKYESEKESHNRTKVDLGQAIADRDAAIADRDAAIADRNAAIADRNAENKKNQDMQQEMVSQKENFARILAKIFAALIFGIPYIAISVGIVLLQNLYGTPTVTGILLIVATLLGGSLAAFLYKKLAQKIKDKIKEKI